MKHYMRNAGRPAWDLLIGALVSLGCVAIFVLLAWLLVHLQRGGAL